MRHGFTGVACLLWAVLSYADVSQLQINVSNIQNDNGELLVAIFNKADNWLDSKSKQAPFTDAAYSVTSTEDVQIIIEGMPAGQYAISIFHDLNDNQKLDTNFIGYPKEPFGFSAPMGKFGPPKFKDAAIEINQAQQQINIKIN
jgi:uncharacterized protein (DUF2141 family)